MTLDELDIRFSYLEHIYECPPAYRKPSTPNKVTPRKERPGKVTWLMKGGKEISKLCEENL